MFGGLEIKGGGDTQKPKAAAATTTTDAATSAFSFLNAGPAAAAPAPFSSGFSFMATAEPSPPAQPATSGFSFMQPEMSTSLSFTENTAADKMAESPGADISDSAGAAEGGSAFSFLSSVPAATGPTTMEPIKPEEASAEAPSHITSAFSFLSSPATPTPPPGTESHLDVTMPSTATTNSFMLPSLTTATTTTTNTTTASTGFPPAGVGVSFGGATIDSSRPKKKKNRAMKVGMGSSATGSSSSGVLPAPSDMPDPTSHAERNNNTRQEALEAARRAEEFMIQKMKEHVAVEIQEAEAPSSKVAPPSTTTTISAKPKTSTTTTTTTTEAMYDDEMIAAAAAAAIEAQAMNQKAANGGPRSKGIMGGLFRRASPPPVTSSVSVSTGTASKPSSFTSSSGGPPKPSSSVDLSVSKPSSGQSLSVEEEKTKAAETPATATASSTYTNPSSTSFKTLSSPPPLPTNPPATRQEPPKPKTPQELLDGMLNVFRQNVEASMGKVTQMRQQRSRLLDERTKALTQVRLASQQRDLTEQQLTAAAEAEDFELAHQLGGLLSNYEKEQKECASMLEHIDLAIKELDSQKQNVVQAVLKCFQTVQTQLETFEATEESKEHKMDDSFMKKFASMTKHLAQEHERLQQDLKHLERDEELVAEELKGVEAAISEQSGDFEKSRDLAKEKLAVVDKEVEELRKKLELKAAEAAQLRNEVAGHEDSILQVRVQFSRQLQRVHKKENTIRDHRHEWEAEKATFQAEKEAHEAEVKAHSEALEKHEKLMSSLKEEIVLARKFEEIVQKELEDEVATSSENDSNDSVNDDVFSLQADVVKCEAAITEAKEVLKVATTLLANLEAEMSSLIARIPELEAIKKAAAAKRDFKTAGNASKEIKDATTRVKECQEELTGDAVERKTTAEKELSKLEEELKEKRQKALEKERETGVATMKKLAERIQRLVETKKEVCGEDYAADRVQCVGAFVLEEQIKSLSMEGKAYGEKYGGWEELIAGILQPVEASQDDVQAIQDTEKPCEDTDEHPTEDISRADDTPILSQKAKEAMKAEFRVLSQELKDIEPKIEKAVEDEDFDLAAQLDEKLQELLAAVQGLDLTDAEMEEALAESDNEVTNEPSSPAPVDDATTTNDCTQMEVAPAVSDNEVTDEPPSPAPTDEAAAANDGAEPATEETPEAENGSSEAPAPDFADEDSPREVANGGNQGDNDTGAVEDGFVSVNDGDL